MLYNFVCDFYIPPFLYSCHSHLLLCGNSFELQALSSSQTETVFNDLLPDNDGVDDFLKSLDIPAQETCSNVPISKSMYQFPVRQVTDH
jgi:hypothetical protein